MFKPALDLAAARGGGGAEATLGAPAPDPAAAGGAGSFLAGVAGVSIAFGLGLTLPGGAASSMGAPHCSQKSPSRSSGPLQNRQVVLRDAAAALCGAKPSSGLVSTEAGRGEVPASPGADGTRLGGTAALRSVAEGGGTSETGGGGEGFAAAELETVGSTPGPLGESEGARRGTPHWVQNFNPSGSCALHLGHAAMPARRCSKSFAQRQTLPIRSPVGIIL